MKRAVWTAGSLLAALLVFVYWLGTPGTCPVKGAAPPLSLEGYLDEKLPEGNPDAVRLKVDNSACYVCHDNYREEPLVVSHGKEEIGCIDCHGPSHDHRDDEDNITPPDKMFAPDTIDPMCAECHDTHDAPGRKVIQRWQERCPAKTDPKQLVCTDCHFQHRLRFRTVWWNKKTGELVIREKGQRTKALEDLTQPAGKKEP